MYVPLTRKILFGRDHEKIALPLRPWKHEYPDFRSVVGHLFHDRLVYRSRRTRLRVTGR